MVRLIKIIELVTATQFLADKGKKKYFPNIPASEALAGAEIWLQARLVT